MDNNEIIYSLCVEDVQAVANERLGREFNESEMQLVKDVIGDAIDWVEIIETTIYCFKEEFMIKPPSK